MWERRAERVRRDVAALGAAGLGVADLHAAAQRAVGAEVGADLTCWAVMDPESLVISGMISGEVRIPPGYEPVLAEAEYSSPAEPHRFAELAATGRTVTRLSELAPAERAGSIRLNRVWRPLGLEREARVVFVVDGACWGAAGMARSGRDFSDRETGLLAAVAPAIAAATRVAVRGEAAAAGDGRPAVAVVGPAGELRSLTPAAVQWRDRVDDLAPGQFALMMGLLAARGRTAPGARARLRDADGRWAIAHADPLVGDDEGMVVVTLEPATGDRQLGLMLAAYALTAREREICAEVLAGRSTAEIADRLCISAHTVQDHLKAVFAKTGVHSRGGLAARLRGEGPAVG